MVASNTVFTGEEDKYSIRINYLHDHPKLDEVFTHGRDQFVRCLRQDLDALGIPHPKAQTIEMSKPNRAQFWWPAFPDSVRLVSLSGINFHFDCPQRQS